MRNIFTSIDDVFTSLLCSMATGERRLVTDDRGNKTPGGTRGGARSRQRAPHWKVNMNIAPQRRKLCYTTEVRGDNLAHKVARTLILLRLHLNAITT